MYSIGIDIGGTSIKAGLVKDGKIIEQNRLKTAKTPDDCINNIVKQINCLLLNSGVTIKELKGIGVGCPGTVATQTGIVEFLPNLNWENVPLVEKLKKHFNVDIRLSNDANVAVLAETLYGCAKGYKTCVMFTIGTGIGGGIVIDNKLFEGGWSKGAELGHTTLYLDGEKCSCGRSGCIERYISATALIEQTKQAMILDKNSLMWQSVNKDVENVSGETAFECEKKGDKTAKAVVDNYVKHLSESILNMLNVFRPEAFILGGGVSAQGKNLTDRIEKYCENFDYGYKNSPKTRILTATLGNDAGIIGAAELVEQ